MATGAGHAGSSTSVPADWAEAGVAVETEVKEWLATMVAMECGRITKAGSTVLPVGVKNMGLLVMDPAAAGGSDDEGGGDDGDADLEGGAEGSAPGAEATAGSATAAATGGDDAGEAAVRVVTNRIEADTAFDFTRIARLLVSDPVPCAPKPHFNYVNVILFSTSTRAPPLLLPYVYDARIEGNDLQDWMFVNKNMQEVRHHVDGLAEVKEAPAPAAACGAGCDCCD